MRWEITCLVLIILLTGCTREIIRENTIIKDSTPALEARLSDLKDKVAELETKLEEYESNMVQAQVVTIPQVQVQPVYQSPEEIPPAPLNITFTSTIPILTPETIIEETNKSLQEKAKITELLNKYYERVKSYSFIYAFTQTPLSGSTFYMKDKKIKIKLKSAGTYNFEDYFDTIYLDVEKRTAKGYCEDIGLEACRRGVNEYNLSYEDYKIKTPFDWFYELETNKDELAWRGDVILFERSVALIQKGNTFFWVDQFSGLPMRVKIKKETFEEMHDYRRLSLNYLSESDVIPK